jgi:hypothetical protein
MRASFGRWLRVTIPAGTLEVVSSNDVRESRLDVAGAEGATTRETLRHPNRT